MVVMGGGMIAGGALAILRRRWGDHADE